MENNCLKYCPSIPGKISQFYKGWLFFSDFIILCLYTFCFQFILGSEDILDNFFLNKFRRIFGETKKYYFFNNARAGLFSVLVESNLGKGSEILLNPNTCSVVCDAVIAAGFKPKFLKTNMLGQGDTNSLDTAITPLTKAIILTNTYGIIEDYKRYDIFCKKRNLMLINDLAQANLSDKDTLDVISNSDIAIISFGPEKYLGGLGGGAVILNCSLEFDGFLYEVTKTISLIKVIIGRLKYHFTFLIYKFSLPISFLQNSGMINKFSANKELNNIDTTEKFVVEKMNPIIKLSVLMRLFIYKNIGKKEKRNFNILRTFLGNSVLSSDCYVGSVPSSCVILLKNNNRYEMAQKLAAHGFQTLWNYVPLYKFKAYSQYEMVGQSDFWKQVIQIPYRFLSKRRTMLLASLIEEYDFSQ